MSLPNDSSLPDDLPRELAPAVQAPSAKRLIGTAWPLILINLAITGMQFVDGLMVAPLGPAALAAILPAMMLFLVPILFGHGMLALVNTFVAQHLGAGERSRCGPYAMQGIWFSVVFGLLLGLQALWAPFYFRLLGHVPGVQAMEVAYYRWMLLGAVPQLLVVTLSNFYTGLLRPGVLIVASFGATILNIAFNWIFIYGHLGFPAMGVGGAALGTAAATWLQALFLLATFWRPSLRAEFGTGHWRPDFRVLTRIFRTGAPAGLMPVFDLLTWGVFVVALIGLFGTEHLAANSIVVRYLHLLFMPSFAIGAVLTAMVGQSIGSARPDLAVGWARLGVGVVACYMATLGFAMMLFRGPLMRVFTSDPAVIAAGSAIFVCVAIYQLFDAAYLGYSHALRGAGDTLWPTAVMLVSGLVVLVGGASFMVRFFPELTSLGPWMATTAHTVVLGVAMTIRWSRGGWRTRRLT